MNVPTPCKTIVIFSLLTFCFLTLGIIFLAFALSIKTIGPLKYVDDDGNCLKTHVVGPTTYCRVDFTPDDTIKSPHVYIDITNFYSSHRNFAKSIDRKQLRGTELDDPSSLCSPIEKVNDLFDWQKTTVDGTVLSADAPAYPCGQIAKYFFSDTLELYKTGAATFLAADKINLDQSDLAHGYEKTKYKNSDNWQSKQWLDLENEFVQVWF